MDVFGCFVGEEALIHLRGADIPGFLQGQLTCDMRRLAPGNAVAGALCNVKGRVLSDLKVLGVDDQHALLRLRRSVAVDIADTLRRYAQFSRITVEVDPDPHVILGVYGELTDALNGLPLPPAPDGVSSTGELLVLRHGTGFAELIAPGMAARTPLQDLARGLSPGLTRNWQAEFLGAGHYAIETADSGAFTPQALNYDQSGRVAFDKGCYTGQEVVARLHYKGQSKRRLACYTVTGSTQLPERDQPVLDSAGATLGVCLRCEQDWRGRAVLAAQVRTEAAGEPAQLSDGGRLTPLRAV